MKEKIITIKVNGASQGQWSNLLLELNLIRKAWKAYGVDRKTLDGVSEAGTTTKKSLM